MFRSNPVKKLQRLLRDFPWLWAIRNEWNPSLEIRVRHAHEVEDLWRTLLPFEHFKVWIHLKDTAGRERILPLKEFSGQRKITLARGVYLTGTDGGGYTQHVAIDFGGTVDIFRETGCGQEPIRSFDKYMEIVGCF